MYAFVENGKIVEQIESLPDTWRHVSGFNLLKNDSDTLKSLGWYISVLQDPVCEDPNFGNPNYTCYVNKHEYIYDEQLDIVKQIPIMVCYYVAPVQFETPEEIAARLAQEEAQRQTQQLLQRRQAMICTNYQARAALYMNNLYDTVNNLMQDANTDPLAKMAWEYGSNFYRFSPFISAIGPLLNLTDEQIDNLFEQAMQIP